MSESQKLIEQIQRESGLADRHIADFCGVSREHINRVKCGKERGSEELVKSLKWLLQEHHDEPFIPSRKPYTRKTHQPKRYTPVSHQVQTPYIAPVKPTPIMPFIPQVQEIDVSALYSSLVGTEKWAYSTGKLCLACQERKETKSYKIEGQWAKLCPDCASLYVPGKKETNATSVHTQHIYTPYDEY